MRGSSVTSLCVYESPRAILDGRRRLLIRVGSNVRPLKRPGDTRESGDTVSLRPDREAARRGIEPFHRHLKQSFGRRKLRSARAENALPEPHRSLAGLWAMAPYALIPLRGIGGTQGPASAPLEPREDLACLPADDARLPASGGARPHVERAARLGAHRPLSTPYRPLSTPKRNQPKSPSQKAARTSRTATNHTGRKDPNRIGTITPPRTPAKGVTA